ncbi:MAG: hypothetical protein KJ955_02105 [Nanoarchaeota archaeon]|nr:hypothetical protein [Nanoarchaeota archaeon]
MNSLLRHWKPDSKVLEKVKIKEDKGTTKIAGFGQLKSQSLPEWAEENIRLYVSSVAEKEKGMYAGIDINGTAYSIIKTAPGKVELGNADGIINALLDEEYYPKKRPSYSYFPFPYTKIPVFARLFLFKVLLKFKKDPGFPAWPVEKSVEAIRHLFMGALSHAYGKPADYIGFWPKGQEFALLLTHDCDSETAFKWVEYIREMEKNYGFRSSWNIVPKKYYIDFQKLRYLKKEGCEIGIHDYDHTGSLPYLGREEIAKRISESKKLLSEFNPQGFRSALLNRNAEFLSVLAESMLYDSSIPDTDIYSPVYFRNGACTIYPFFIKSMVELPLSMQQDFRLKRMGMKPKQIAEAWKLKLDFIARVGGLATLNVHPDDFISGSEKYLNAYEDFMKYASKLNPWNEIPANAALWWKERDSAALKDGKIIGSKRVEIKSFAEKL